MTGLTDEQVNARIAEGKVNADENPNTRTYKQIVRENTLTFFNFLNLVLLVLVMIFPLPDTDQKAAGKRPRRHHADMADIESRHS